MTTDAERFESYIERTPTCWLWTGKLDRDGYGLFWYKGKWMPAHHYAYIQKHGSVPEGMEIDHICHRRNCVNDQHLEAKTHADNLANRLDRIVIGGRAVAFATDTNSSTDSGTTEPSLIWHKKGFQPGHDPRRNLSGRPKKGESLPELLKRSIERPKVKAAVVTATVERLLRTDAVGNRAFADVRDTVYGIPKQTLVLEQADSPLAALIASISEAGGMRQLPEHTQHNDTDDAS